VACIGSGPSSLTCAGYLAGRGIAVTVFEACTNSAAFGLRHSGIPAAQGRGCAGEIQAMRDLGVEFRTNWVAGKTVTVPELLAGGYQAVFIGVGGRGCRAFSASRART